jgi:tetratricopeptide (TPR) repeat protein
MHGAPAPKFSGSGRKYAVIAAAAAAVVVAVLGGYYLMPRLGGTPNAPTVPTVAVANAKPSLAVLYFENLSGDEDLNWLRTGLTDMLVTDLAQSPNIRVLGTDRLHQILEDIGAADDETTSSDVVEAVAEQGNVENVLLGSFARAGNMIRISARLQVAASGEILSSETVEGVGEESIFQLVDDLTRRIKSQFDMPEVMIAADVDADLSDVTTDSVEAYRNYAEGIMMHEQLRTAEAIPLLERAIEIDPNFAMALAKLATAYNNVGNAEMSRRYSQRAMDNLDRVNDRERYYIEGRHYSLDQETVGQSIEAYQKAIDAYPDHTAARNNLAQQLLNLEEFDEAIEHLEELRRSKMQFPATYASLATAYARTGRFAEGLEVLVEYTEDHPDNAAGYSNLAGHLAWAGRYDEALDAVEKAEAAGAPFFDTEIQRWQVAALSDDWDRAEDIADSLSDSEEIRARGVAHLVLMAGALFEGDLEAAADAFDDVIDLSDENFVPQARNMWAAVQLDLGDWEGALETAAEMIEAAGGNFGQRISALALRATALAQMGDRAASDGVIIELFELAQGMPIPPRLFRRQERTFRGEVAFQAQDWEGAIEFIAPAIENMPRMEEAGNSQRTRLHYLLGVAYFETSDLDRAETSFLEGLEQAGRVYDPIATVRSLWYLGRIYESRGDETRARQYYQRFVDYWGGGDIDEANVEHAEDFLDRMG